MDEFEKVNETLETEETKAETETVELPEDNEPVAEAEETESEAVAESSEQTDDAAEIAEDTAAVTESVPVYGDAVESVLDTAEAPVAETKKPILQRTIITAACIFLAALLVFGIFVVVNNIMTPSLEGVWVMTKAYTKGDAKNAQKTKTSGKEAVYYNFKSDGNFVYTSGTIKQTLKWSYVDGDGKKTDAKTKKITVYTEASESNGNNYGVKLDGGFFAEKKLKLEVSTDLGTGVASVQIMEFKACDGSDASVYKMAVNKSFKPVNDLLGTWNDKTTKQKITFNKDGSYVLAVSGNLEQTGNYTVDTKKSTVSLSYIGNGVESDTGALPYKLKDGKLTLATYTFEKAK